MVSESVLDFGDDATDEAGDETDIAVSPVLLVFRDRLRVAEDGSGGGGIETDPRSGILR